MANRAGQALVTAALEPEWEARFEPNSYGFRPGAQLSGCDRCHLRVYRRPSEVCLGRRYRALLRSSLALGHPPQSDLRLYRHGQTVIRRHVKVHGVRSPYDGDWVYWRTRLGHHPEVSPRVARLLKRQQGKCPECGLFFTGNDRMEVDHIIPQACGGTAGKDNLQLLHRHCHDHKTARDPHCSGASDKRHVAEEPCEGPTLMHGFGAEPGW